MVIAVAQFTAKTTNPEKAVYYLSLMSRSINKLKSIFETFTCKNFMFSDFMWKKKFAPGNGARGGDWRFKYLTGLGLILLYTVFTRSSEHPGHSFNFGFSKGTLISWRLTLEEVAH